MELDRGEVPEALLEQSHLPFLAGWSSDGKRVHYVDFDVEQLERLNFDIWEVSLETGAPRPILESPKHQVQPAFSPDGLWLAYMSVESGQTEVYLRRYDDPSAGRQISIDGGRAPVWAPNGRRVYYRNEDKMMVVRSPPTPRFPPGAPPYFSRDLTIWIRIGNLESTTFPPTAAGSS